MTVAFQVLSLLPVGYGGFTVARPRQGVPVAQSLVPMGGRATPAQGFAVVAVPTGGNAPAPDPDPIQYWS